MWAEMSQVRRGQDTSREWGLVRGEQKVSVLRPQCPFLDASQTPRARLPGAQTLVMPEEDG